jgi:hypothetical protein
MALRETVVRGTLHPVGGRRETGAAWSGSAGSPPHPAAGEEALGAKHTTGRIEVRKPLLGDAVLVIAGCGRTKLAERLRRQVEAVEKGVRIIEQDVPVHGCFCFLNPSGQAGGSGLPLHRTLSVDGFPLYPRRLSKRLNRDGPIDAGQIAVLAEALVELFPAA